MLRDNLPDVEMKTELEGSYPQRPQETTSARENICCPNPRRRLSRRLHDQSLITELRRVTKGLDKPSITKPIYSPDIPFGVGHYNQANVATFEMFQGRNPFFWVYLKNRIICGF